MYYRRTTLIAVLLIFAVSLSIFSAKKIDTVSTEKVIESSTFLGVWINYIEFADMINGKNETQYKEHISGVIGGIKDMGFNTVVLHIRSHSDAFYRSDIFPFSSLLKDIPPFDPLLIFTEVAHSFGVEIHGWINPYRIAKAGTNISDLNENNPAVKLYNEGCVSVIDEGIYYIPSEVKAQKLIIDGVKEIITKYSIDGIHFDDYFYPTTREDFDKTSYENYKKLAGNNAQSLENFRRQNVNCLILGVYQAIKSHKKDIVFGVSPSADISKNYTSLYADVSHWIEGEYIDYICPQIYFGFEYKQEDFQFENLLSTWGNLCKGKVKTVIGLAAYKSGEIDRESDEWVKHNDILSRQAKLVLENETFSGICIYNYSSLIAAKEEQRNLSEIIFHTP